MRSGVAPSGNHRHMPPLPTHSPSLPPPPPPVAPPLPNSSSSSTLSAWAPPFTFDYFIPAPPPPAHHPSVPPQALLVSDRPSSSRLPSLRSQTRTGGLGVGDPYYAHYYPSSQLRALDDSFGPSSAFSELGPGPWNKPFDEEVGHAKLSDTAPPWGESSFSYTAPSFQEEHAADGNVYSDKDSYGVWNGKFADSVAGKKKYFGSQHSEWLPDNHSESYEQDMGSSYSIFNAPISTPSALLNGIHRSATIGSTSRIGSHDTSVSNSTYNHYMAQLDSCSADPLTFHPSATSSTSIEVHGLSNLKTSTNINSTLSSVKIHHGGSYKIKGPSVVLSSLKEANLNQNLSSKGGHDAKICNDYSTNSFMPPAVSGEYPPSSNNQATESPLNLSLKLSSESRLASVVIADPSSRSRSLEPDNSIKNSSEAVDQHNLAVDSPCWKGAPSSRQSPFSVNEMLPTEIKESNENNDTCFCKKTILVGVGNSKQSAEQVGNLKFGDIEKSSLSENPDPEYSAVASSSIQQKTEGAYKKLSDYIKDPENEIMSDTASQQQINATIEAEKRAEAQNVSDAKSDETESNSGHEFPQAKGIVDNIKDPCFARQKNINDLVKSIHSYSVELLSTNFNVGEELEAHDCRLLYSAISNITLLLNDKKDLVGFNHRSCLEPAGSCNISENTRVNKKNMNHNCNMKGKTFSVGCNCLNDEFNNFVIKCGDADLKKVNSNTQSFENSLYETFYEREENEGTLFYKNLWIQAEVMTCRLKQELLLAQMKIESENSKPPRSDISSSLPSQTNHEEHNLPSKPKDTESIGKQESVPGGSTNHQSNQVDDTESSVMARFKILNDRNISSTSRRMEEDCVLDLEDFAMHSGANTNIGNSPDIENDSGMYDLPINLTDLRFMEPGSEAPISWSFFRAMPHTQPLSAMTDEADDTLNRNSRQMTFGPLNGSLIQSYMTSAKGKGIWTTTSSQENTPSGWEHVPHEDSIR